MVKNKSNKTILDISIEKLELSTEAFNCLYRFSNIRTIGDLSSRKISDLANIRSCRAGLVKEITEKLENKFGIILEDDTK